MHTAPTFMLAQAMLAACEGCSEEREAGKVRTEVTGVGSWHRGELNH